ncbi:VOC family protein [Streptomyces sp. A7024]|uniref:VOC family protein n=1 Tax=Streptomyces coryli TaxID=1128680 RepID=A0A6G4TS62_9ACTN|nr:VOC family protein [Streptomyces coryli]NGN62390.1 VOC family protein [Streptomyces coryli]
MITTDYVPGAPNWVDLTTTDVDGATDFYRAVFGWEFASAGPDAGGYGYFQLGGRTVAAVGPFMPGMREGDQPYWTVYFTTTDADATVKAVEQAGGRIRNGPMDVFTAGRQADLTDATGADFAVWQPRDIRGLDAVTEPGTFAWAELYTTDRAAAVNFYRTVLDWRTNDMEMPGMGIYTVASAAGATDETGHAGIMELPEESRQRGSASEWHPYFEVSDCDAAFAKAVEKGASEIMAPMDAEGVGRFAMFTDPAGAMLAIITSAPAP